MNHTLVWYRRDLRVADHPALAWASSDGRRAVPVYVHAPHEEAPWAPGGASRWWLHRSLQSLAGELDGLGLPLTHLAGDLYPPPPIQQRHQARPGQRIGRDHQQT